MKVTALARPAGKWWAIEMPDINDGGIFTQARHFEEVAAMAAEAAALVLDVPESSIEIDVVAVLPDEVRDHLAEAERLRLVSQQAQSDAAEHARIAARTLRATGMPLRDVGAALGVSVQRAHQLVNQLASQQPG